jgi:high affinity Mn2+ porin
MSRMPNGKALQTDFHQFELVDEAEVRFSLFPRHGKIRLLGFLNRARTGSYNDALSLAEATHAIPDTSLVRKYGSKTGIAMNIEQPVTDDIGAFARLSFNNGDQEAYEFTEANISIAAGLSFSGSRWGRAGDTVGVAAVVDQISNAARRYLAAGGLGILVGDGRLPHYATEDIVEVYYSLQTTDWLTATLDYQFVANPAYNPDRGPVSIIGLRLRAAF